MAIGCVYLLGLAAIAYFLVSVFYVDVLGVWRQEYGEARPTENDPLPPSLRNWSDSSASPLESSQLISSPTPFISADIFDECLLVDHDEWDDELRSLVDLSYDPLKNCNRSFVPLTQLTEDGVLRRRDEVGDEFFCEGRCARPSGDYTLSLSDWLPLPDSFLCDVVEARCSDDNQTVVYNFLHTQVIPLSRNDTSAEESEAASKQQRPSVYIILFDSVADTQSIRSFPKTVDFLQKEFGSFRFRHLNKVGDNSRPNGAAFILGRRAYIVDKTIFGIPSLPSQWSYETSCLKPLDSSKEFIFSHFADTGYRTLMAEDWAKGVFNWPNCTGFVRQPTDHYMKPFQLRFFDKESPQIARSMGKENCLEHHQFLMNYLQQFIRAYPDDPKFGMIWMSYLSHDDPNVIFHADDYVRNYFEENKEEFDKSFVFFMGDHGLRFGKQRESRLGRIEVNNPMLHLIVPRHLRESLRPTLESNSRKLLTMYDLYATFVDIAEKQPVSNFSSRSFVRIPAATEGSSLLRELNPSLLRNCRSLPIPFDYCPCSFHLQPISNSSIATSLGEYVLGEMMAELRSFNLLEFCSDLSLSQEPLVEAFVPQNATKLYKITFEVTPGGGKFETIVRADSLSDRSTFSLASPSFNRFNAYGSSANCITRAPQKPFCYCRNLLSKEGN